MIRDFFVFSLKNLGKRKLRSWLTLIGIFIGIASVVSLIGLGEGLRTAITGQFGFLGADVLSIQASGISYAGPPGAGVSRPLDDSLADKIKDLNNVETAFNRHIETFTLEFNDRQTVSFAASVPSGRDRDVFEKMVNIKTQSGRLLKEGDNKRVVMGADFAEDDLFGKPIRSGDTVLINDEKFEVIGILEKKGSFIFDSALLMNEEPLLEFFGDPGSADVIAVKVKHVDYVLGVQEDVEKLLRKERDVDKGEEDFEVQTPQAVLETLDSTLLAVQIFIYMIAAISLLVGGIGIMNTMYTAVLERTKEIGIMKSVGAQNYMVFILFFIESGFLGLVGGAIGVVLGLILAYGFAFIGTYALGSDLIQAQVSLSLIMGALTFSFTLGTIFGVLPAIRASKLQPVESLRSAR